MALKANKMPIVYTPHAINEFSKYKNNEKYQCMLKSIVNSI